MKNNVLKGSLFIALGATSYGMLATFVKMAYQEGFTTAEVTISQYGLGFIGLLILNLFRKEKPILKPETSNLKSTFRLIFAGTSLGLTSTFYYLSVQYISVSVAIVLLMQTVWMGVIFEIAVHKKMPGLRKIISVFIILAGTFLATNLFQESVIINWKGFLFGILAAMSYTATMYSSNHVELHFPPLKRSLFMIIGGCIVVAFIFNTSINSDFSFAVILRWGILLSLFGTILPPLLFTKGMPLTGMGLGAIIASVEIPVSIAIAYIFLDEPVSFLQWIGVILILFAVAFMNLQKR
ncbi:EamA family transporter [Flavobacterium pectinovorum]|uniref:EamA family transporter n=1 Tax=Flavobacterium pectinovorum TaxID=29533 RepID=A0AB36P038_9FLAO|nr:DMT family transporter [Flavobacterium pectinovorum]OXB04460.1 EamA family transporter [Flavobacterium pectinovorum]SHL58974.1 Permease of the drug/metabolite transporter (DMT) superfamily [Flavobacterium pectinovorum]